MVPVPALRPMSAQIDEVSSAFPWRGRVVVIGNTERYVSIRQRAKNSRRIPTGMTELKAVLAALRKKCQEGSEPACVRYEVRRQLKEDWSRLVAKDRQALVEEMQAVDRILGQAFPVGDELRRLPGEDEVAPGLITPTPDRLCCGRAIEDAIQLHCVELARVIFEVMFGPNLHRKEWAAPGSVAPARSSNEA